MGWIDWCIVVIPLLAVLFLAVYARRYARSIVDFLAAGRVAGRYVISVGDMASALSIISVVGYMEAHYQTGFAVGFWYNITVPVVLFMSLTGYCTYRFRQTRVLSMGQFLEQRYNRKFRIFAAILRSCSEMLTNAIGPAIAARFFIYYFEFPHTVTLPFVGEVQTYAFVVTACLMVAIFIIWPAGRISLLLTDTIQGLLSYPIFIVISFLLLYKFSWFNEITPVLSDRVPGESFLNPLDVKNLRDFNVAIIFIALLGRVLNHASWIGNGTSGAGRSPHEQKMAGVIGSWRTGFYWLMLLLLSISLITFMTHRNFAGQAKEVRTTLANRVADEVVKDPVKRESLKAKIAAIPIQTHIIGQDVPLSQKNNLETIYLDTAHKELAGSSQGNFVFQQFRSLYFQMMLPISLHKIFPPVVIGLFALLMVMLLISTDDSRIFNSAATLVQDLILPFYKGHLPEKLHLLYIRLASVVVGLIFFLVSVFCVQLDFITMFITIAAAIWLGGAGPVMIFGLYSRFGNSVGAFCAIIFGSGCALCGIVLQRTWAAFVYPFLRDVGWSSSIGEFLEMISSPLSPYVVWTMNPIKFPINSYEIFFISMLLSISAYVIGSLVSYRKPYNLDKLLHRGEYNDTGIAEKREKWTIHTAFRKIIGITPEYTRFDRIIARVMFFMSIVWGVGITFLMVLIWNVFQPWPGNWWQIYFFITSIVMTLIIGIISTVWFTIGGIIDTRRLFHDLEKRVRDPNDNGQVRP